MIQATTPTIICRLPEGVDLSLAENIYFTLQQPNMLIRKTGEAVVVDGREVSVYLAQRDTVRIAVGTAKVQLNWTYSDGSRGATREKEINIEPNSLLEVLE